MNSRHIAMPEWLGRDDLDTRPWEVEAGEARRGEAFTNLVTHRMRVPLGSDETSRCIRAHELMHARVSPVSIEVPDEFSHIGLDTVVVAEEFRVNMLTGHVGFPIMKYLSDGSERRTGERLAESGDWNDLVHMVAATSGTKSLGDLLSGVRRVSPDWATELRRLAKALDRHWKGATDGGTDTSWVASTRPIDGAPEGWQYTLDVACLIHRALIFDSEFDEGTAPDLSSLETRNDLTDGCFADLIELPMTRPQRVDGRIGRRKRPSGIGRHPRHLDRMLTDPDRRIFERRTRGNGGVVVIDQSGSMRLNADDLWRIIEAAPGCVIIGYSHGPGSDGIPNVWVLADRGRVVETVPDGNGGNGVDGPALEFALKRRRASEPLIWVCDGYVTDRYDRASLQLTDECARLVAVHGIHQVHDVDSAVAALSTVSRGHRLGARAVGPIAASTAWRSRSA
ncbi:MAG: hypothetical protein ACKOCE_02200 [Acidimicrobiia bacterium]